MKRSEMVMVAAKAMYRRHVDAIKAKHPGCSYNISVAQFYKDAKFMMNAIEEAGMLPPYNENHGISNYDLAMGQPVEATNKWENEDEEK